MKKANVFLSLVAIAALSVPAIAGENYEKCSGGTQECLDKMTAKMQNKGWVGIELEKNEDHGTMSVTRVIAGSPAEAAGLQAGDELLAMNGISFADKANHEKISAEWGKMHPGKNVVYTVNRDGYKKKMSLTLARVPDEVMAQWVGGHMLEHAAVDVAQN